MELIIKGKNYKPGSIGFSEGFLGPKGDVGFQMEADHEKAKGIIQHLLDTVGNIESVEMGLDGDWRENSMIIWEAGTYTEYDRHESSQWAESIIIVNYTDRPSEAYPVWKKEGS